MPHHPLFDVLVEREVISAELAQRAAQVPLHTASSSVARLVSAGGDRTKMLRAVAELVAIPVATRALIASSAPVKLSQNVARALRVLSACPVQRDANGVLHVLIAEPDVRGDIERLLPGSELYLAHEDQVRDLLEEFFPSGSSIPDGAPVGAIDIDMEASSRVPAAPAAAPAAALAPAPLPADPLAPRASGPMKMRSFGADDETMRIERAPRARPSTSEEKTVEDAALPVAARSERAPLDRAYWRGVAVGAGVTGAVATLVIVALLLAK